MTTTTTTNPRRATRALASFESSDWSEDLESSLNSFRGLREEVLDNDDNDSAGVEAEASTEAAGGNANRRDDSNPNDEEDDDDDERSDEGGALRVPDEFVCPLTLTVMRDPVVSRFGHSYERDAILSWLVEHRQTCPLTRKPLSLGGIITNHQLRGRIRKWQLEHEMDVTVLCSGADFDPASMASSKLLSQSSSSSSSMSRLGGFYIVPDLDDTERSTDDEADEDAHDPVDSARRRLGRLRAGAEESGRPASTNGRRGTATTARRASASGGGAANNANLRRVSGISRRFFGSRPAAA
jgi:U-box domain